MSSPGDIRFLFADAVPLAALCEAFNEGFSDYKYGVELDETQMERFLEQSGVLRENSAILLECRGGSWHGAGLALMGLVEERHAWCSGLAVAPALRSRGHARTLIEMIQQKAATLGAISIQLEVLVHNESAIRLYRTLGYSARRDLLFWRASPEAPCLASTDELIAANPNDFIGTLFSWQAEPAAWQRTRRSVEHLVPDLWGFALHEDGRPLGYVACLPTAPREPGRPRVRILGMAAAPHSDRAAVARRLIAALRTHLADTTISVINEPEGSLFSPALQANGFVEVDRQTEMWLDLTGYPRKSS